MSEHTSGPWAAFDDEIVQGSTDQHIADVPLTDGVNPTEWQANMRLIAAAPDLLDTLKAVDVLADAIDLFAGNETVRDAVKAVIAKAEGRS